jgi:hypothetical protein
MSSVIFKKNKNQPEEVKNGLCSQVGCGPCALPCFGQG